MALTRGRGYDQAEPSALGDVSWILVSDFWGTLMRSLRLSIMLFVLTLAPLTARAATLTVDEASKHVGEDTTVCGTVAGAKYAAQSQGSPTFIDFGKPYPNATFTALILGTNRAKFGTPEKGLQGKQVCVTGKIQLYQGRPEIILNDPKQLVEK
jgi:DNA/RNA endonuclease YhcR with UshA esterase domain